MKFNNEFPSVVKYMGSKTEVLGLIEKGVNYLGRDYDYICDLFAGSATLSGALRGKTNVISNDVQEYSSVFSKTYLNNYDWKKYADCDEVCAMAYKRVKRFNEYFSEYHNRFNYDRDFTLEQLNAMEEDQRKLILNNNWADFDDYYLFVKDYSGTYWSFEQCVWIDSYRYAIDKYKNDKNYYYLLLSCLIYAMAYNSQSTGHYAQYRIPEKESSKNDILIYRRKNITDFFKNKFIELKNFTKKDNQYSVKTMSDTDVECIKCVPKRSLIYADPPYCFVHYSRFYHIIETLVKYDYPVVKYKGRYRDDRYQSEFCIRSQVSMAFKQMFAEIKEREQDLILSYSNSDTNTINYQDLIEILCKEFIEGLSKTNLNEILNRCEEFIDNKDSKCNLILNDDSYKYEISIIKKPYEHSRMGRTMTKTIPVTELVIIAKCIY